MTFPNIMLLQLDESSKEQGIAPSELLHRAFRLYKIIQDAGGVCVVKEKDGTATKIIVT